MRILTDAGAREMRAVWLEGGRAAMLDQRLLPERVSIIEVGGSGEMAEAIRRMAVRGAPSIGAAAAYGMCLAAMRGEDLDAAADALRSARPTANDLFHAVDWMLARLAEGRDPAEAADAYAQATVDECLAIGRAGAPLIRDGAKVMTHCNAGALATVDVGTALAPMRRAHAEGRRFLVYVSETRPRLQGMRLTAWELGQEGIEHFIIPDGASGHFMREGVDAVIVGADRVAANGDFANKIGTFEKAVLAKELGVPFYVAAPRSTFDFATADGSGIVIEDRPEEEVTEIGGVRIAPAGSHALNPSFDMTPARYVDGFITAEGVLKPGEIGRLAHERDLRQARPGGGVLEAVRPPADVLRRRQRERPRRRRRADHAVRQVQGRAGAGRHGEGRHGRGRLRREAVVGAGVPPGAVQGEPGRQRGRPLPSAALHGARRKGRARPVRPDARGRPAARRGAHGRLLRARLAGAGRRRRGERRVRCDGAEEARGGDPGPRPGRGVRPHGGAGVPGGAPDALRPRPGPDPGGGRGARRGAEATILVTKWFGAFLCDGNRVVDMRLLPKDPRAMAEKLALIQRGGVLPEEAELAEGRERLSVSERRQSPLGKPAMFDSSFISASAYGYGPELMHEAMLLLGRMRTSEPVPRDRNLVQAIRSLDDVIETANLFDERLHEWYGMHFPELADFAKDARYAELVAEHGERSGAIAELQLDIESVGADFEPEDMAAVRELAETLRRLHAERARLEAYISGAVSECCPNLCALTGGPVAARLISLAGGLERLASLPSSTVQLLGAEKAMFRHLRSGKRPPKHGVLYQCPEVRLDAPWRRGKVARALAGKALIAAKIDWCGGEYRGDALRAEFERRAQEIARRYPDPPKPKRAGARRKAGGGRRSGGPGQRPRRAGKRL